MAALLGGCEIFQEAPRDLRLNRAAARLMASTTAEGSDLALGSEMLALCTAREDALFPRTSSQRTSRATERSGICSKRSTSMATR